MASGTTRKTVQMNEQQFIIKGKNYSTVLIIIIFVLIGMLLYMSKCKRGAQPNAFAEKMMKEKTADSIKRVEERKQYQDSLREINGKLQLHESIISSQFANLKLAEKRIDKLLEDQKNLPAPIPFDSTSSIVSNHWIENCAECFVSLKNGRDSVKQYIHERDELDNLYKNDTALKGRRISQLESDIDFKDNKFASLLHTYVIDTKPKSHLYAGSKVSGNLITPFNQVGGMLNYLDKKGRMFTVGGGLQTQGSYYGEIGISIRIF